jgi:hypothetical protein
MKAHASSEYSVDRLERQPRVRVAQFRSSVETTEYLPTDPPILVSEPEQSQITRFETWKRVSHPNGILRTARYSHFSGGNLPRTSEARVHWNPKLSETASYHRALPSIHISRPDRHSKARARFEKSRSQCHPRVRVAQFRSSVETIEYLPTDPPILVGEPEQSQITRFETWKRVSHPNGILRTARYSHFSGGNVPRTRTSAAQVHWKPKLSETVSYHRSLPSIHVSRQVSHDAKQKTQRKLWWKMMIVNTFMFVFFWKAATLARVPAPQVVRSLPPRQLIFNESSVAMMHLPELIASNASRVVYCIPASVKLNPSLSLAVSLYAPTVPEKPLRIEAPSAASLGSAVSLYVDAKPQAAMVASSQLSVILTASPVSGVYCHLERLWVSKQLALSKGVVQRKKVRWQIHRQVNCCLCWCQWRIAWEAVMVEPRVQRLVVDVEFGRRMWRIAWAAVVVVDPGVLILVDLEFGRRMWRIAWIQVVVGPGVLRFVKFKFGRRLWRIAWVAVVVGPDALRLVEVEFGRRVWRIPWDAVVVMGPGALRLVEFEFGRRVWRIAWGEIPIRCE